MLSLKNSMVTLASFLIFGCMLPMTSSAQTASSSQSASSSTHSTLSASDQKFMKEAAQGGAGEVEPANSRSRRLKAPTLRLSPSAWSMTTPRQTIS